MTKKNAISLLLFLAMSFVTMAQITHTSSGNVDQNATKILNLATKKLAASPVSFTVAMTNLNSDKKETARAKADVIYNKGKYRVSIDGNVIYCDGSSVWHWNKDAKEVTVNKMTDDDDNLMNPAAILANYNKNYRAKFIRLQDNGDAVIDLTPKTPKSYHKIRLFINADSGELRSLEMHNYDSSRAIYQLSNYKSNVKLSDNDFTFPKSQHTDVEVIDMR